MPDAEFNWCEPDTLLLRLPTTNNNDNNHNHHLVVVVLLIIMIIIMMIIVGLPACGLGGRAREHRVQHAFRAPPDRLSELHK